MVDGIALRHFLYNFVHLTNLGIELKKISLNLQKNVCASSAGCAPPQSNIRHMN